METKIGEMQAFFGLEESGQLDHRTLEVMGRERCGVPDVEQYSSRPNRPKWKNHTITYRCGSREEGVLFLTDRNNIFAELRFDLLL